MKGGRSRFGLSVGTHHRVNVPGFLKVISSAGFIRVYSCPFVANIFIFVVLVAFHEKTPWRAELKDMDPQHQAPMESDYTEVVIGAGRYERTEDRTTHRNGSRAQVGCVFIRSCSTRKIRSEFTSRSRRPERSALMMAGKAGNRSIVDCIRNTFPIRTRRSGIVFITSRCTRRGRMFSSCKSIGTSCEATTPAIPGAK